MGLRSVYGAVTKPRPPPPTKTVIVVDYIKKLSGVLNTLNTTYDREFAISTIERIKTSLQEDMTNIQQNNR